MIKYLGYILLLSLHLSLLTYADTYNIKLASYSNKQNLVKKVKQLEPTLQNNIIIIQEDNLYKLFSQTTHEKNTVLKLLPHYQKIFPDAFIKINYPTHRKKKDINLISSLNMELNLSDSLKKIPQTTITKSKSIIQPNSTENEAIRNLYQLLNNKTYYLCPDKIHSKAERLLIQADFNATNVKFTTLVGTVPPLSMPYIVQDNRLYLISNGHISPSQFSTLDKIYFEYMIVSRWMKGTKIHQMRYYKKEEDGRSYLESVEIL